MYTSTVRVILWLSVLHAERALALQHFNEEYQSDPQGPTQRQVRQQMEQRRMKNYGGKQRFENLAGPFQYQTFQKFRLFKRRNEYFDYNEERHPPQFDINFHRQYRHEPMHKHPRNVRIEQEPPFQRDHYDYGDYHVTRRQAYYHHQPPLSNQHYYDRQNQPMDYPFAKHQRPHIRRAPQISLRSHNYRIIKSGRPKTKFELYIERQNKLDGVVYNRLPQEYYDYSYLETGARARKNNLQSQKNYAHNPGGDGETEERLAESNRKKYKAAKRFVEEYERRHMGESRPHKDTSTRGPITENIKYEGISWLERKTLTTNKLEGELTRASFTTIADCHSTLQPAHIESGVSGQGNNSEEEYSEIKAPNSTSIEKEIEEYEQRRTNETTENFKESKFKNNEMPPGPNLEQNIFLKYFVNMPENTTKDDKFEIYDWTEHKYYHVLKASRKIPQKYRTTKVQKRPPIILAATNTTYVTQRRTKHKYEWNDSAKEDVRSEKGSVDIPYAVNNDDVVGKVLDDYAAERRARGGKSLPTSEDFTVPDLKPHLYENMSEPEASVPTEPTEHPEDSSIMLAGKESDSKGDSDIDRLMLADKSSVESDESQQCGMPNYGQRVGGSYSELDLGGKQTKKRKRVEDSIPIYTKRKGVRQRRSLESKTNVSNQMMQDDKGSLWMTAATDSEECIHQITTRFTFGKLAPEYYMMGPGSDDFYRYGYEKHMAKKKMKSDERRFWMSFHKFALKNPSNMGKPSREKRDVREGPNRRNYTTQEMPIDRIKADLDLLKMIVDQKLYTYGKRLTRTTSISPRIINAIRTTKSSGPTTWNFEAIFHQAYMQVSPTTSSTSISGMESKDALGDFLKSDDPDIDHSYYDEVCEKIRDLKRGGNGELKPGVKIKRKPRPFFRKDSHPCVDYDPEKHGTTIHTEEPTTVDLEELRKRQRAKMREMYNKRREIAFQSDEYDNREQTTGVPKRSPIILRKRTTKIEENTKYISWNNNKPRFIGRDMNKQDLEPLGEFKRRRRDLYEKYKNKKAVMIHKVLYNKNLNDTSETVDEEINSSDIDDSRIKELDDMLEKYGITCNESSPMLRLYRNGTTPLIDPKRIFLTRKMDYNDSLKMSSVTIDLVKHKELQDRYSLLMQNKSITPVKINYIYDEVFISNKKGAYKFTGTGPRTTSAKTKRTKQQENLLKQLDELKFYLKTTTLPSPPTESNEKRLFSSPEEIDEKLLDKLDDPDYMQDLIEGHLQESMNLTTAAYMRKMDKKAFRKERRRMLELNKALLNKKLLELKYGAAATTTKEDAIRQQKAFEERLMRDVRRDEKENPHFYDYLELSTHKDPFNKFTSGEGEIDQFVV